MSLALVTAPTVDVLTLAEAKDHLRVTSTDDDTYITALIKAAQVNLDGKDGLLGRALLTQTWKLFLDSFPNCRKPIIVPLPPLQSVSSIKYIAQDGTLTTWDSASYSVDTAANPARVHLGYNEVWPVTRCVPNAVTIEFVAGYGATAAAVPDTIKAALKLMIGHWYQNREPVTIGNAVNSLPMTIDYLLSPYRMTGF